MCDQSKRKGQEGSALVIVTLLVAVCAMVLITLGARAISQNNRVDAEKSYEESFMGIEAAIIASARDIENGGSGYVGVEEGSVQFESGDVDFPEFDASAVEALESRVMDGVEYFAFAREWSDDDIDNNGDGLIDGPEESGFYTIYAAARKDGSIRTTEVVSRRINVNIWGNAMFGGAGEADGVVEGDVKVHGSVHFLGDNVLEGNKAFGGEETTLANNYDEIDPDLINERIDFGVERLWQDETVLSLNALVNVKNGYIELNGETALGANDQVGNDVKETIDGLYVTDGWMGDNVEPDGVRGEPTTVYADNGVASLYNLGDKVRLPLLGDQRSELDERNHWEYFGDLTGEAYDDSVVINTDEDFFFNASQPESTDPEEIEANDDYIWFTAETNQLVVNGQVRITGDLTITAGVEESPAVANDKVFYSGIGAILVDGDITLETALLTGTSTVDESVDFEIDGDRIIPLDDYTAEVTVLGVAIQSGSTHLPVTASVNIGDEWNDPWGGFSDPANANLNDGEIHPWELPETYPANTAIGIRGRSYMVSTSGRGRRRTTNYSTYMTVDSWQGSQQVIALRDGDPVPETAGFMQQDSLGEYIIDYTDQDTNTITLLENQIIYLFELGTTNLGSSAADFQDLVVLVSLFPANMVDPGEGGGEPGGASVEKLRFPENVLGFMAGENMYINGNSTQVMGAFYSQNDIVFDGSPTVFGAMVANHYEMGNSIPRVAQVPVLQDNMPEGMIGTEPIISVDQLAWRERTQ